MDNTPTHSGWSEILVAGKETTLTEIEVPIQIRVVCDVCGVPFEWGFVRDEQGGITVEVSKTNCDCITKKE